MTSPRNNKSPIVFQLYIRREAGIEFGVGAILGRFENHTLKSRANVISAANRCEERKKMMTLGKGQ